jgi:hypothetical protein
MATQSGEGKRIEYYEMQLLKNEERSVFGDPSIFSIVMEFHF